MKTAQKLAIIQEQATIYTVLKSVLAVSTDTKAPLSRKQPYLSVMALVRVFSHSSLTLCWRFLGFCPDLLG